MTERDSAPGTGTAEDAASSDGSIAPEATDRVNTDRVGPDRVSPDAGQRVGQRPATRPVAVRPVRAPIAGLRQRMESTAALRRSLDAREAEALDLRASIDRLRQELDRERGPAGAATSSRTGSTSTTGAPSAPAPRSPAEGATTTVPMTNGAAATRGRATAVATGATAPVTDDVIEDTITRPARTAGRSRRTWLWALAAVVLTLLVLLLISRCGSASTPGTGTGSGTVGAGASATATVDGASPVASGPGAVAAPATTPMAWPSGAVLVPPGLPTTGPGLNAPGSHMETAVDADGSSIDAYESLILPGTSTEPLVLALAKVEGSTPTLRDVQVELDGKPVALTTAADGSISAAPTGGSAYIKAVVRYRLAGAVSALQPAKANRAAAMVTLLTAGASQAAGTPVVVRTADGQVIAAECPTVELAQRLCAAPQGGVWTATVPASAKPAAVYLLLDTTR